MKPIDHLLLGRPIRALETIAAELARVVGSCLSRGGRREIKVSVAQARFVPIPSLAAFSGFEVTIDPHTVLAHMTVRYGLSPSELQAPLGTSSTERRIQAQMRDAVTLAVEQALYTLYQGAGLGPSEAAITESRPSPAGLHWAWQAEVAIQDGEPRVLSIALDNAWSQRLEQCVAVRRDQASARTSKKARATTSEAVLQVELTAQLMEFTMTAAELQTLRTGTVIPIVMGRAVALLNGSPMLSAAVAEHHGKLHLTAFETLE